MVVLPLNPAYRMVEVDEFLAIDLGEAKAELVNGVISVLHLSRPRHAAVTANIIAALGLRLRGSCFRPYGSDLAVRTGPNTIRFPDVSIYRRSAPPLAQDKLLGDPRVIFEVLSASTASNDQIAKLAEYCALPGVATVVFVDPDNSRVRPVDCPRGEGEWLPSGVELALPALGVTLTHEEIFAD